MSTLEYRAILLRSLASAKITSHKPSFIDVRNPVAPEAPEGEQFVVELLGNAYHIRSGDPDARGVLMDVAEAAKIRVTEDAVNISTTAPAADHIKIAYTPGEDGRIAVLSASNNALRRLQTAAQTLLGREQNDWARDVTAVSGHPISK